MSRARAKWSARRARSAFATYWTRYGWRDDEIEAHLTRAYLAGWEAAARRLEALEDEMAGPADEFTLYTVAAMLDNERHARRKRGAKVTRPAPSWKSDALIYLASPYTAPTPEARAGRHEEALRACEWLEAQGWMCFSPIAYGHQFALRGAGFDWHTWQRLDQRLIRGCDLLVVLCVPGWERSTGVAAEREYAQALGKPVWCLIPHRTGEPYELMRGTPPC